MRAIDADAFAEFLRDAIKQQKYDGLNIDELLTVADVIEAIISELDGTSLAGFKNTPTIEPDIVKCKDCKHRGEKPISDGRYWCDIHNAFMYYCSDAERRTDEEDLGESRNES